MRVTAHDNRCVGDAVELPYNVTSWIGEKVSFRYRRTVVISELQQIFPKAAFYFSAKAWQGLKVFFDQDYRLLYRAFAYTLVRKSVKLFCPYFL